VDGEENTCVIKPRLSKKYKEYMRDKARAQKYMGSEENTCVMKPRLSKNTWDTCVIKPRREKYMIEAEYMHLG